MPFLVLGGIACPTENAREISKRIYELKSAHGLDHDFEIKWTKVSPSKVDFYLSIVDYFFDDDDLTFRCIVAPKDILNHEQFNQTHDDWYYKMMYLLIRGLLAPRSPNYIYLDKKDTRSKQKVDRLHQVIANSQHDFDRKIIRRVQVVESHHVAQLQIADLLLGAVNYRNRGLNSSLAKSAIVDRIRERTGFSLTHTTVVREEKFNILRWTPRGNY